MIHGWKLVNGPWATVVLSQNFHTNPGYVYLYNFFVKNVKGTGNTIYTFEITSSPFGLINSDQMDLEKVFIAKKGIMLKDYSGRKGHFKLHTWVPKEKK